MAYGFVAASGQVFTGNISVINRPLTMSVWLRRTSALNQDRFVTQLNQSTDQQFHRIGTDLGNVYAQNSQADGFGNNRSVINATILNTWVHAVGIFTTTRARVWLDGSQGTLTNTDRLVSTFDRWLIGNNMDGQIGDVGVWDVELNSGEIVALAKGFKPSRVRPQSLVYYAPLIREVQEVRTALTLTASASAPTVATHHRVY
jgi:hypothetical protein